ncbi:MAG: hypothetical protein M5U12_06510 [Verrucomicrobia bacterium]|nr:hypothetical protein [Verrucomicrobiota bacterium]
MDAGRRQRALLDPAGEGSGISASWDIVPGRFWVFTTSTAFEAQHVYRPWHVFAVLECGGDFTAAARRLVELGYGATRRLEAGSASPTSPQSVPTLPGGSQDASQVSLVLPPILSRGEEQRANWPTPVEIVQGCSTAAPKG